MIPAKTNPEATLRGSGLQTRPVPARVMCSGLKKSVDNRYFRKAPAEHSINIAAIEGAYDAFIENWELTFQRYPNLLTDPENWKQIEKCADNLQRYLDFIRTKHQKILESQRQGG